MGLALVAIGCLAPSPASASGKVRYRTIHVKVHPGDTLIELSKRYEVPISAIRRWNPNKVGSGHVIHVGDRLVLTIRADLARTIRKAKVLEAKWRAWYRVRSGDTLGTIADKVGCSVADLRRLLHLRHGHLLQIGQELRYEKVGRAPTPHSVGRVNHGYLVGGKRLGDGPGYRPRFPKTDFGLPHVVATLQRCAARVAHDHPGTADLLIGDLSRPAGGRFPPHVSHQSGRDADVGYYLAGNIQNTTLHRVRPSQIDFGKTWELLRCLITTDHVVRVFMDRHIQRAMARYLSRHHLVSDHDLDRLFQVHGRLHRHALIWHAPGHDTHFHVRFACAKDDGPCQDRAIDTVFRL